MMFNTRDRQPGSDSKGRILVELPAAPKLSHSLQVTIVPVRSLRLSGEKTYIVRGRARIALRFVKAVKASG